MELKYIVILIFILSALLLVFAIGLWLGRPKIKSSEKEVIRKAKKDIKRNSIV